MDHRNDEEDKVGNLKQKCPRCEYNDALVAPLRPVLGDDGRHGPYYQSAYSIYHPSGECELSFEQIRSAISGRGGQEVGDEECAVQERGEGEENEEGENEATPRSDSSDGDGSDAGERAGRRFGRGRQRDQRKKEEGRGEEVEVGERLSPHRGRTCDRDVGAEELTE